MHTSIDHSAHDVFARALGDEIRQARKARGWTRKQLQARLSTEVSVQTLGTYELGTRQCSVARLAELCQAMNILPHDLLARVYEHTTMHDENEKLLVDLDRVLRDRQPELTPLRRWARQRLDQAELNQPHTVRFNLAALDRLAELCGVTVVGLIGQLQELASSPNRVAAVC